MRRRQILLLAIGGIAAAIAVATPPAAACVPRPSGPTLKVVTTGGGLRPVLEVRRVGFGGLGGEVRLREVVTCPIGVCFGPELDLEIARPATPVGFAGAFVRPAAPLIDGATYELSLVAGAGPTAPREIVGQITVAQATRRQPDPWPGEDVIAVTHRDRELGRCVGASWSIELAVRDWAIVGPSLQGRWLAISLSAPAPTRPVDTAYALVPLTGPAVRFTILDLALPNGARPTRVWGVVIDGDAAGPPFEIPLP